jgi:tetratricopeptide (TPR) repeat protein
MLPLDPKHALTVLTRLAARRPNETWKLGHALKGRLDALAVLALKVGAETGDPIGRVLASLLTTASDLDLIERIYQVLPAETVALREVALEVTRHRLAALRQQGEDASAAALANTLTNLAHSLAELGRREDALGAAAEAVALRRRLAETQSDVFAPSLGTALLNLAERYRELGRREEALATAEEAIQLYRRLGAAHPSEWHAELARALGVVAIALGELGRDEDALAAAEEAVGLRRTVAEAGGIDALPPLANSLNTLANLLSCGGRREEAIQAAEEVTELYHRLAEAKPDAFLPHYAAVLNNLALRRYELWSMLVYGLRRRLAPRCLEPPRHRGT